MSTFLSNVESARKQKLVNHLGIIYSALGDYRLNGLHMVDGSDDRFVKALGEFADLVEAEAMRIGAMGKPVEIADAVDHGPVIAPVVE
jgi:hypothetical protein